ncbi:MAG TPA: thioredoxin family protein [Phycisphaerales bacterium]|nr:thioredoxin family protein [Phycisphaerales bacterium]
MSHPFDPKFLLSKFTSALPYEAYVATGKPNEIENWKAFLGRVALTGPQREMLGGFTRQLNVLCISGTWCGDCVQQCPFLERIESANPKHVNVRFVDRDAHKDLAEPLKICGGLRVPVALFLNEDFELLSLFGDRSLARYRNLAARQLGGACPLPGAPVPPDEIEAELAEWVAEFERVHLMLRLSNKMRHRYGD